MNELEKIFVEYLSSELNLQKEKDIYFIDMENGIEDTFLMLFNELFYYLENNHLFDYDTDICEILEEDVKVFISFEDDEYVLTYNKINDKIYFKIKKDDNN